MLQPLPDAHESRVRTSARPHTTDQLYNCLLLCHCWWNWFSHPIAKLNYSWLDPPSLFNPKRPTERPVAYAHMVGIALDPRGHHQCPQPLMSSLTPLTLDQVFINILDPRDRHQHLFETVKCWGNSPIQAHNAYAGTRHRKHWGNSGPRCTPRSRS